MFQYKDGQLCIVSNKASFSVRDLCGQYGPNPFYVYDLSDFKERLSQFQKEMPKVKIHYALKANHNTHILKAVLKVGGGVDVVSGGELSLALKEGFKPGQIIFSGVGKSITEMDLAIGNEIKQINVESLPELKRVAERAKALNKKASVALRVNPDVNPETHPYIKTGFRENKFGIDSKDLSGAIEILKSHPEEFQFSGVTIHIGSQIRNVNSFKEATEKSLELVRFVEGHGFKLKTFDVGGGLGIDYNLDPELNSDESYQSDRVDLKKYSQVMNEAFSSSDLEVLTEPGRFLVARCGALLTEIQYIKKTPHKNFIIVNTGMHHLMRPSLYQAYHRIVPVNKMQTKNSSETSDSQEILRADVVGPICESSDVVGYDRIFSSDLAEQDFLAILDVGAYGYVMKNNYNIHPDPQEIVIDEGSVLS